MENKENKNKETDKKKKKKAERTWVSDLYYGRTLTMEFFRAYAWFLILFVALVIGLIGLRYDTKTKMQEIQKLTGELEKAQSYELQEKAAYMSLIRETEMRKLVEERGLGLEFQEVPPYELNINENK